MKKIKIAIKVNGGFGTVLVRANYIHCLYTYLADSNIKLYVYGHKSSSMNDAIFKNQESIFWYGSENAWNSLKKEKFALAIVLDLYPNIVYMKKIRLFKNDKLLSLVEAWENFKYNEKSFLYFKDLRKSKPSMYASLINQRKNILNSADIDGMLGIENEYTMPIFIEKNESEVLAHFKLDRPFITVQRGVNPKLGRSETPKLWPEAYYEKLIGLLKQKYPQYLIVQLGESAEHCKSLKGIDISLLGQTDWDDLKIILKTATLHIDGECGMVHLRKALHAKASVVLFGPTPVDFFGYEGNINLRAESCPHWSAELREDWEYNCLMDKSQAPCMYGLTPEFVFDSINNYFKNPESVVTKKQLYPSGSKTAALIKEFGDKLDRQYVVDWLSHETIWDYELSDIPVKDLFCTVFNGKNWENMPVAETPAYKFLCGEQKLYRKNMETRNKLLDNNIHSQERFEALIDSMKKNDSKTLILVGCNNVIKDGQHRAAIWMHKYGKEAKIKALVVYKSESC